MKPLASDRPAFTLRSSLKAPPEILIREPAFESVLMADRVVDSILRRTMARISSRTVDRKLPTFSVFSACGLVKEVVGLAILDQDPGEPPQSGPGAHDWRCSIEPVTGA